MKTCKILWIALCSAFLYSSCIAIDYDKDRYRIVEVSPSYLSSEYVNKYVIIRDAGETCMHTFFDGLEDGYFLGNDRSTKPFIVTKYKGQYLNWFASNEKTANGTPEYHPLYAEEYRMWLDLSKSKHKGTIGIGKGGSFVHFKIERATADEMRSNSTDRYADIYQIIKNVFKEDYIFRRTYVRIPGTIKRTFSSDVIREDPIYLEAYRDSWDKEIHEVRWILRADLKTPQNNNVLSIFERWQQIPNKIERNYYYGQPNTVQLKFDYYYGQNIKSSLKYDVYEYYFDTSKEFVVIPGHDPTIPNGNGYWQSLPKREIIDYWGH